MLGSRTQGGRMEGADESTELWCHPTDSCFSLVRVRFQFCGKILTKESDYLGKNLVVIL